MSHVFTSDVVTAPDASAALRASEARFKSFFLFACAGLIVLLAAILLDQPSFGFWIGKGVLSTGFFLILVSIIHTRFFDVLKNAGESAYQRNAGSLSAWVKIAESLLSHGRLAGFVLLVASRWTIY